MHESEENFVDCSIRNCVTDPASLFICFVLNEAQMLGSGEGWQEATPSGDV